nr:cell wall hydrolase [Bacillus pinisoli]
MRHQLIWRIPLCIMICFSIIVSIIPVQTSYAFSDQIIQRGATGDDVIELQARLQYNGFYHGPINGVFGWSTYWSVRNFQKEFGLTEVDGFVGQKTKEMLIRATKYYKDFVYKQIEQGNRFTHYGGMPLDKQTAPSPQVIEQAKKAAEQKRATQMKQFQGRQGGQAQQPANKQGNQQAQQPANQQGQQPANEQGNQQGGQQPANPQGNQQAQQPANQQAQQPANEQGNQQGGQQPANPQRNQQGQQQPANPQENQPAQQQPAEQQETQQEQPAEKPEQEEAPAPKETAVNMPNGFSQNDIQLMANAVYGEARGEPYIGQVAVAAVILNRVNSPTFPNTVSGVIFEPRAFTAVADGQIWLTPNEKAKKAVLDAINGFDPTENAIYYFNPDTATSGWIWGRPQIKRIGKHIFCR